MAKRIDSFAFNITYCTLFRRLERLHKLLLSGDNHDSSHNHSSRVEKRTFLRIFYVAVFLLGSFGNSLHAAYIKNPVGSTYAAACCSDELFSGAYRGTRGIRFSSGGPTAAALTPTNHLLEKNLVDRLGMFLSCLGDVPERFMDFLIYVCLKTRYLCWREFQCLWGPLTASILTLVRSGIKRFVQRYVNDLSMPVVEVRSSYAFQITSRAANTLARKLQAYLGSKTFALNTITDESVGCGLLLFVGEDRLDRKSVV